jgi:hypothetical protein
MSHIAKVQLAINDLDCLEQACNALGTVELKRNQTTHKYYAGAQGSCDHAIVVKGNRNAYEIGVVANKDGKGYELAWDTFQGAKGLVAAVGGTHMGRLRQEYATAVAKKELRRKGYYVETVKQSDGTYVLTASMEAGF